MKTGPASRPFSNRARALRRAKRVAAVALAVLTAPWFALAALAALTPLPPELAIGAAPPSTGVVIRDRRGTLLRELGADGGERASHLALADAGEHVVRAIVAAEDRRFWLHPGVDPLAMARAAVDLVATDRVSGASTITQQLARLVVHEPRTLAGKLRVMALALRIERSLSKDAILEAYLDRAPFGRGVRGLDAASRLYFGKPPRDLSLAQAAALASVPRGPSLYDPQRRAGKLLRRRDRVLERMRFAGLATDDDVRVALAEPLAVDTTTASGGGLAPHLVRAVLGGGIDGGNGALRGRTREIQLTVDRALQLELQTLAADRVRALARRHVTAAAIVVLENATGEVLAYVGSHDFDDKRGLGQNDGVLALRQPGSALKPFVYELAIERLGWSGATVLPDVELSLPTKDGDYRPHDYDGEFHGPVRLREALANSYNVPAVWTAAALGPTAILDRLRALGFDGLDEDAEHYGAAIALGDGEVRLVDLANAYATLARGGVWAPVVAVAAASDKAGEAMRFVRPPPRRVLDEGAAWLITDILADDHARRASFGPHGALDLPFPAAAKTGTSKGFRDNLAVGFTPEVTVAVWVGNFDGSPMHGVSGVTGAGPLLHAALVAAMRGRPTGGFAAPPNIERIAVCALSGERPTSLCNHRTIEPFVSGGGPVGPARDCTMHEEVHVVPADGLLAGPGCTEAVARTFEHYDASFVAWATAARRPLAPTSFSPRCPGPPTGSRSVRSEAPRVAFPADGATFLLDPAASARQAIVLRAAASRDGDELRFLVDGVAIGRARAPFTLEWPLAPGAHTLVVAAADAASDPVTFTVE